MKYKTLLLLIWIITLFIGVHLTRRTNTQEKYLKPTTSQIEPLESKIELYSLDDITTFTGYSLSVDETDESPCIGAGNNNLCELKKKTQICASRDLPLDTLIYIDGIGECVIKDRMNKRYKGTNRVDVLFNSKQEAINFGNKRLKYAIL